jgi:hypothetical protein
MANRNVVSTDRVYMKERKSNCMDAEKNATAGCFLDYLTHRHTI